MKTKPILSKKRIYPSADLIERQQPTNNMLPIEIKELNYVSNGRHFLQSMSFSVSFGEIVVLLGPNHSGKSLVAQILAGERVPSSGVVSVLGVNPWNEKKRSQLQIGYLPEKDLDPDPDVRVMEYLLLCARLKRIRRGQKTRSIRKACQSVGIEHLQGKRLISLSRGERRQVILTQALLGEPPVLILDEPFEGLDARTAKDLALLLQKISKEKALLLVTSRLAEAAEIATRFLILVDGKLIISGTPKEIAARSFLGGGCDRFQIVPPPEQTAEKLQNTLLSFAEIASVTLEEQKDDTWVLLVFTKADVRAKVVATLVKLGAKVLEAREIEGSMSVAYRAITSKEDA